MKLTRLEFRQSFTAEEKRAIYAAAAQSVDLRIYLDELAMAEFVDTSSEHTASGVMALEFFGLIAPGRAAQILATTVNTGVPVGGFSMGQPVALVGDCATMHPGRWPILGFGNNSVLIEPGEFDISFLEA